MYELMHTCMEFDLIYVHFPHMADLYPYGMKSRAWHGLGTASTRLVGGNRAVFVLKTTVSVLAWFIFRRINLVTKKPCLVGTAYLGHSFLT